MSCRDTYHDIVKKALEADGWTITHDPYIVVYDRQKLYIDLGAEAPIGAEKMGRRIAVEVKSFLGKSEITELERAIGQYILYRVLVRRVEADRLLYLALPVEAFNSILDVVEGRELLSGEQIRVLVFDVNQETITKWIE